MSTEIREYVIGDGAKTRFEIEHGFGTVNALVSVSSAFTGYPIMCFPQHRSLDRFSLYFDKPPAPGGVRVAVEGPAPDSVDVLREEIAQLRKELAELKESLK